MSDHDFEDYDRFHVMEDFDSYHLTEVEIGLWESDIEILDALKNNTVVKKVFIELHPNYRPEGQEVLAKLSEVMQCNTSVETLMIRIQRGLLGERTRLFASMATSGGWSSIKQLVLKSEDDDDDYDVLSLRDTEQISSFIMQSDNLRALTLDVPTVQAEPMIEALSRTKVQSLDVHFRSTSDLQNGARRLATALERCTCITQLKLEFPRYNDEVEFIQILLVESIPKMLGLEVLELQMHRHLDEQFFDMVGRCIDGHQGEIEELLLKFEFDSLDKTSIAGLAPALRRLKVIEFHKFTALTSKQIRELSAVVADCDTLEEFGYNLTNLVVRISDDDFKAICQLLSKFPSLKRVLSNSFITGVASVDLRKESRFVAFLEMIKTSKTIEEVPSILGKAEKEAAIEHHCHNNMMHNQIELIREKGLLGATVPSSAWPLILEEFSDMPDVILHLVQQKHGALIGPTCHGCKRKQDFD
jgi:hypothetical protein